MAVFGSLETVRAQLADSGAFAAAFAHVEECLRADSPARAQLLAVPPGEVVRTELAGGAFALGQVYFTKPRREARLESHRRHVDVQVMIVGAEFMELTDPARLTLNEDRTPGQDVLFYENSETTSVLRLDGPGATAVFFPADAHLGSVMTGNVPTLVRKVVVKVPVA
jgi:biofilm protein TabA